ncbi:hypothetical protein [Amycolatopsis sp. NPDC004079]|uniref:hypothetical protein n=1 Tax=Amycolatopsis sp. NPDC004079 TaxID=3154549 RepID=UPI0033A62432
MATDGNASSAGKEIEEVFADRLKFEHELIGQRVTWLMTLNSILVGAIAVVAANAEKTAGSYVVSGVFLVASVMGTISNASCLFSNYWATRAISEAGRVLADSWRGLDPSERSRRQLRMRLYGRDPRSFDAAAGSAPSHVLHPWLMLPSCFLLLFSVLPFLSGAVAAGGKEIPSGWAALTLVLTLSPFVVLPMLDLRRRRSAQPDPDTSVSEG